MNVDSKKGVESPQVSRKNLRPLANAAPAAVETPKAPVKPKGGTDWAAAEHERRSHWAKRWRS